MLVRRARGRDRVETPRRRRLADKSRGPTLSMSYQGQAAAETSRPGMKLACDVHYLKRSPSGASFPSKLGRYTAAPSLPKGLFFGNFLATAQLSYTPVKNRTKRVHLRTGKHQSSAGLAPSRPIYPIRYRQNTYFSLSFNEMPELACSLLKPDQE